MLIDSRDFTATSPITADVCIIGGGPAGIATALGLLDSGLEVVVLERGGPAPAEAGSHSYRVFPGRRPTLAPDPTKPAAIGGNTNYWFGNCRPLDEVDFERREWVPYSGWPISRAELIPYYDRAQSLLGLGDFGLYDLERTRALLPHPPLDVDPDVLATLIIQSCPGRSIVERHWELLESASNLKVLLHARARAIETDAGGERASAVEVACADAGEVRVEAGVFVLASGGVENARLLLASDGAGRGGIGNGNDLVGRFFMEHWYVEIPLGDWQPEVDAELYRFKSQNPELVAGTPVWAQLALSEELMRTERLPAMSLYLTRAERTSPSVLAAKRIKGSVFGHASLEPGTDLGLLLSDPAGVAKHLVRGRSRREDASDGYVLRVQLEQVPDPENRVRLAEARDEQGSPIPEIALRLTEHEVRAHQSALVLAAEALGLRGGRILRQFRLMLGAGRGDFFWHHMGSTRMASDPADGVVDADCRVHGLSNLFVAGSSVFPTGGIAAPTLTIVALALRLADLIAGDPAEVAADAAPDGGWAARDPSKA